MYKLGRRRTQARGKGIIQFTSTQSSWACRCMHILGS